MGEIEPHGYIFREPRNLIVLVRRLISGISSPFGNDPYLHVEVLGGEMEVTIISGCLYIDAELLSKFSHECSLG
jgi:hypothetical protein